jgi:hypothetical protein
MKLNDLKLSDGGLVHGSTARRPAEKVPICGLSFALGRLDQTTRLLLMIMSVVISQGLPVWSHATTKDLAHPLESGRQGLGHK